jgi:ubiquinone/menaquinone biosynthesis C-methylase UbiE
VSSLIPREAYRAAYYAQHRALLLQCVATHQLLRKLSGFDLKPSGKAVRDVRRRFAALLRRDLSNVENGFYPKEALFQIPVSEYARLFPKLISDFPRTILRARRKNFADLPNDVKLENYPAYYRRNFHWQTDGYLSRRSAELYDVGVELLFLGTADVMRRQIVPPIARELGALGNPRARVLDVATGTGSALRQIAQVFPDARYYGLDLSPYYVDFARERLTQTRDVTFLCENAEAMPFRDGWFEIVTSVYLFHELPRRSRRRVLSEMYRVLKPGGLLVLEDSAQPSEGGEVELFLDRFADDFHEPFYRDYLKDDLSKATAEVGFRIESVEACFVSKLLVARKPLSETASA